MTEFDRFIDELEWALEFYGAEKALNHAIKCAKERRDKPGHHHTCQKASKDYRVDKQICTCGLDDQPSLDCQHYGTSYCFKCGISLNTD